MRQALITGSGMLATALAQTAPAFAYAPVVVPHSECNVIIREAVLAIIREVRPALVLHTAALTRVNYCEEHPEEALEVNGVGTRNVVEATEAALAHCVYFSTDYVFDGRKDRPWVERDQPSPLSAYGRSKLEGEKAVGEYHRGHIVRTSGLFGPRRDGTEERNFFRAIAEQLRDSPASASLRVVSDQETAVTAASHLAAMVFSLFQDGLPPLVHITSTGHESWYGWACLAAAALGENPERVRPVTSAESGSGAPRPRYSVLGSEYSAVRAAVALHPARPAIYAYLAGWRAAPR